MASGRGMGWTDLIADVPEERNACNRALSLGEARVLLLFRRREGLSISTISMSSYER